MGKSSKEGKETVVDWVRNLSLSKILDIGAGSGTYKKLCTKNCVCVDATWIAIEAWQPYIDDFKLNLLYHQVLNQDVRNVDLSTLGMIDITFMGDVLEHVSKHDAMTIVDRVMAVSKFAVISIPIVHWPQAERHGNPYEVHVKDDWSHHEVMTTFSKYIKKFNQGKEIGVYWLETL